jgi:hypothetical protein
MTVFRGVSHVVIEVEHEPGYDAAALGSAVKDFLVSFAPEVTVTQSYLSATQTVERPDPEPVLLDEA